MGETINISTVANKISHEIFSVFHWTLHPRQEANFECVLPHHVSASGKQKDAHPEDVIFHYFDPYLGKRIYLHTDLKSYSKSSIQTKKVREALHSLAWAVECAHLSSDWKDKFVTDKSEPYEVRGMLLVVNHDNLAQDKFTKCFKSIAKTNIPVAQSQILHVLSPERITDLYAVACDIKLEMQSKRLSANYRFFYPDLVLWKRHIADDERTGATLETLMSPYFIVRHDEIRENGERVLQRGSVVYYARPGSTFEEFVYLLDSLLRYQLVNSKEQVRIRVFCKEPSPHLHSNFERAKNWYCSEWGFEASRAEEIQAITVETISRLSPNYSPDQIGWKEDLS